VRSWYAKAVAGEEDSEISLPVETLEAPLDHVAEADAAPETVLNEPQTAAAAHVEGPMVVFAGAGSGKTRVITYRIANLLAACNVPPYEILAVTFTNKAAGEMKRRLELLVGPELVRDLWVGTFHAICARLLRRYHDAAGLTRGFVIYDDDDQRAVMNRAYKELGIDDKRFPPRQTLGRIHREKQEGTTAEEFTPGNYVEDVVKRCFVEYERRLAAANAVDFDDLLLRVLRLLEDPKSTVGDDLRRKFQHVLVDEFQDVNNVQYRLVSAFAGATKNLFVVGDDDQSIYRWRGADVRIVRNFKREQGGARIVKLEQNYRSSGNIVNAALAVIRPAKDREPKELFTENPPGALVLVVGASTERDEAAFVAERIRELADHDVELSEVAVFYRMHAQSRVLEEVLRADRIAYQVIGGMRFFERAEVKDLIAYLRVLSNPKSDVDLMRIINVPSRKIGDTTTEKLAAMANEHGTSLFDAIEPLVKSDRLGPQPKKALARFHALLTDLAASIETVGPRDLAERVLEETGYQKLLELDESDEAEARLLNLGELLGSIGEFEEEVLSLGEVPTVGGYLERITLSAAADDMKDAPRVALMTVHAAKGLEFGHVFIVGLEEDTFPFRSMDPNRENDVEEERRLAYVAVTRARHKLTLLHTERRSIFGTTRYNQPSRFLADLPPEVVSQQLTESRKAGAGRFIDREGWGAQSQAAGAPRLAWSAASQMGTPRAGPHASVPVQRAGAAPQRAAGERFVERDDDAPSAFGPSKKVLARALGSARSLLSPGSYVEHKSFGRGRVLEVDDSADPVATVKFAGWQPKRIKVSFLDVSE